jgi:hypothetical protein
MDIDAWKILAAKEKTATLVMLQSLTLARELATRTHAPSQSLMQPPLSRSRTPAASRKVSRFFRVRMLGESPRLASYSAYFGSAKVYLSQPFRPSMDPSLSSSGKMSTPKIGAIETSGTLISRVLISCKSTIYTTEQ